MSDARNADSGALICELVQCQRLRRPHHVDTHFGGNRTGETMDCTNPLPAPVGAKCWQCTPSHNVQLGDRP